MNFTSLRKYSALTVLLFMLFPTACADATQTVNVDRTGITVVTEKVMFPNDIWLKAQPSTPVLTLTRELKAEYPNYTLKQISEGDQSGVIVTIPFDTFELAADAMTKNRDSSSMLSLFSLFQQAVRRVDSLGYYLYYDNYTFQLKDLKSGLKLPTDTSPIPAPSASPITPSPVGTGIYVSPSPVILKPTPSPSATPTIADKVSADILRRSLTFTFVLTVYPTIRSASGTTLSNDHHTLTWKPDISTNDILLVTTDIYGLNPIVMGIFIVGLLAIIVVIVALLARRFLLRG